MQLDDPMMLKTRDKRDRGKKCLGAAALLEVKQMVDGTIARFARTATQSSRPPLESTKVGNPYPQKAFYVFGETVGYGST